MNASRDPDRLIVSYLEEGQTVLPDRVYDEVRDEIERIGHGGFVAPWRDFTMARLIAYGLTAAVAVVAVAFIGFNILGSPSNVGGPVATATPSPTLTPSSPTPEPTPVGWLSGAIAPGRHTVNLEGHSFSFATEQTGWSSGPFEGMIVQSGSGDARWIAFFNPFEQVSTDPCSGAAQTVGPTVDDFANAMTTIPGTDAVGPTDTTVGGLPAKLVVLTIHADIGCAPTKFNLYGPNSAYPNNLSSVMSAWIVEVDGARYVFQAHYGAADSEAEAEISKIIGSIEFN